MTGGDVVSNPALLEALEVDLRARAGVSRDLDRVAAEVSLGGVGHQQQSLLTAAARRQCAGDDHLMRDIEGSLGIVTLNEAIYYIENKACPSS